MFTDFMTTIAYRDGVLAADSLVTSGSARAGSIRKIAASGTVMGGLSGSVESCQRFVEWIEAGAVGPIPDLDGDSDGLLVRGRKAFYVGPKGVEVPFRSKFAAVGSGERFALGAMAAGANAVQAAKIACRLDINSAGPVVSLGKR